MRDAHAPEIPTLTSTASTQDDLRELLSRFVGTVVMTLVPVALIAFPSMPPSLNRHPGEAPLDSSAPIEHMT
jgi:hypothetical protein